ncbi:MAG TPA: hypothetical protein PKE55_07130 [Kiritimatiellia bacterium]|nr:hypothetical protein [Kiritimatiellia bacterium]
MTMKEHRFLYPIVIGVAVLSLYAQTWSFLFVNYDDPLYVEHIGVLTGFTRDGLREIWTTHNFGNWQPITLMSHALDIQLFDLRPGAHHLVSALLHAINGILLFVFFSRWTGNRHAAFLAALLWAIHPQNVDAVAWISQRKTLLSTLFGLCSLLAYLNFRIRPTLAKAGRVVVWLLLGLMAKGVLVTVPLIMIVVIDLLRFPGQPMALPKARRLAPGLFILSLLFGIMVMVGQGAAGSIVPTERFSMGHRFGHAMDNVLHYALKLVVPTGFAIHYPPPEESLGTLHVIASTAMIGAVSWLAWTKRATWPWLGAGWFWYLINLAPLSGLLATGQAIRTDRFAYIPTMGLFLILGWLLHRWLADRRPAQWAFAFLVLLLCWRTAVQVSYWRNDETIYRRALSVTRANSLVHNNLAVYYIQTGQMDKAAVELVESLRLLSTDPHSWGNLEMILASPLGQRGLHFHLQEVAATHPNDPHYRLVRFMIALVQIRTTDARRLWEEIMEDPASDEVTRSIARSFLAQYEMRHGALFGDWTP